MVCPFEPIEKQALLEAPSEAERAETLLALLRMGAADTGGTSGDSSDISPRDLSGAPRVIQ
jgi:Lon protease-like protein